MRIISADEGQISLGRQGENQVTRVQFSREPWKQYGDGVFQLIAQRHGDAEPYPVNISTDNDYVYWDVLSSDTAVAGTGRCELQYRAGEKLAKSRIWTTIVQNTMDNVGAEMPEPYQSWMDKVLSAGSTVQALVDDAREAASTIAASADAVTASALSVAASETNAAAFEESAASAALSAAGSAGNAASSAASAATSETNASSSAAAAAACEENAASSETAAANYATAAANSAAAASGSASDAAAAATDAAAATIATHNAAANAHTALFSAKADATALTSHTGSTNNPHSVTAAQIGAYSKAQTDGLLETMAPVYGKGVNLLDNWYFGNADAIIDQRGGYVVTDTATYYTDSALTQNPVTVSAYTTVYAPDVHTNYVGFYLTSDTTGTKYYASRTGCVRGYVARANYTVDRWTSVNVGTVLLLENSQLAVCPFENVYSVMGQTFETPLSGTFTFSFLTGSRIEANNGDFILMTDLDGVSGVGPSFPKPLSPNTLYSITFTDTFNRLRIYGVNYNEWTIKSVKLELGGTQTLAHQDAGGNWVLNDPPPNYQQELAKCQRYYQLYATQSLRPSNAADCRPVMRTTPAQGTISVGGTTYYYNDANL